MESISESPDPLYSPRMWAHDANGVIVLDPAAWDSGYSPPALRRGTSQLLAKRAVDVVGSLVLLLLLLPLLVAIVVLIRLSSSGPALFMQERVGKDEHMFRMYKFRTMFANSNSAIHEAYSRALISGAAGAHQGAFKLRSDPRVTPLGRILRALSLDELPQLVNVLKGDMSLVGPRPPLPYEVELYGPRERHRLAVPPGITGLWQVSGRSALNFQQMIQLDLSYIEHWSIWLDLKILLRTPLVVIRRQGAY